MSEREGPSADLARGGTDGRLPYEKPAVTWEQPLELQPSLMSACMKIGGDPECASGPADS
jgi:hypothetical protein